MGEVFAWWLIVELLGIAALPLSAVLFARLPDRGWALAKPLGVLVVGWLVWFPLSVVTALPYNRGWIAGTILIFALGNLALLVRVSEVRAALARLLARERAYLALGELVFAGAFALMAWVRSFTPAVVDQEKFMDVGFLSAIWRTPHLPPPDPWLSGYPINYYYFGHFLLATLAKLLGTAPAVAFNVGIALIFALTAVAVFGVGANLLAAIRLERAADSQDETPRRFVPLPALAGLASVLLVLILGNLDAAQTAWAHAVTLSSGPTASLPNPWAYFTNRELWLDFNWWDPSRVIPNTINEFPAFSFLLSDLHAHVLALPFAALAIALALSFIRSSGEGLRVYGSRLTGPVTLIGAAILLGALYAINGWDLPTYLGLALLALAIQQWLAHGRRLDNVLLLDFFAAGAALVALAVVLYLPFYRGFVSPSQGVGIVPGYARSPVRMEFAIFGLQIAILGSYLVWQLGRWLGAVVQDDTTGVRRMPLRPAGHTDVMHPLGTEVPEHADGELKFPATEPSAGTLAPPLESRALGMGLAVLATVLLVLITLASSGFLGWTLLWALLLIAGCAALALHHLGAWELLRARRIEGNVGKIDESESEDAAGEATNESKVAGEASLTPTSADPPLPTVTNPGLAAPPPVGEGVGGGVSPPANHHSSRLAAPPTASSPFLLGGGSRGGSWVEGGVFLLCLVGTAAALVAACELVFLRDVFAGGANGQLGDSFRMNTVFKLYYQAWLIAGIACGPALVLLLRAAWRTLTSLLAPLVAPVLTPALARMGTPTATPAPVATNPRLSAPPAVGEGGGSGVNPPANQHPSLFAAPSPVGEGGEGEVPRRVDVAKPGDSWVTARSSGSHDRVDALRFAGAGGIVVWMALLAMLVAGALVYPVLGSAARTQNFSLARSLDGTAFMASDAVDTGDAAAIAWLNQRVTGDEVIVEAAKYDEYTHLGRISAFTGLPTLLGWGGHELQWRVNWLGEPGHEDVLAARLDAVNQIYTNPDEASVKQLLRQYSVRLIYVGTAERQVYPSANLDRFAAFLPIVYQHAGVTIYAGSGGASA